MIQWIIATVGLCESKSLDYNDFIIYSYILRRLYPRPTTGRSPGTPAPLIPGGCSCCHSTSGPWLPGCRWSPPSSHYQAVRATHRTSLHSVTNTVTSTGKPRKCGISSSLIILLFTQFEILHQRNMTLERHFGRIPQFWTTTDQNIIPVEQSS